VGQDRLVGLVRVSRTYALQETLQRFFKTGAILKLTSKAIEFELKIGCLRISCYCFGKSRYIVNTTLGLGRNVASALTLDFGLWTLEFDRRTLDFPRARCLSYSLSSFLQPVRLSEDYILEWLATEQII
jgi:hypothetical protein